MRRLSPNSFRISQQRLAVAMFQRQTYRNGLILTAFVKLQPSLSLRASFFLPLCQTVPCLKFLSLPCMCCLCTCVHVSRGKISTSWQNGRKHVRMLSEREPSFLQLFLDISQNLPLWLLLLTLSPCRLEGIF